MSSKKYGLKTKRYKEASSRFGLGKDYFFIIESKHPKLFARLMELGEGDILKGFEINKMKQQELKNKLANLFYLLKEKREIANFSNFLYKKGVYSNPSTFRNTISRVPFRATTSLMKLDAYDRLSAVCDIYYPKYLDYTKKQSIIQNKNKEI